MTTSLVTGGAGFIGSHLVEHLLSRGDRVLVLDDLSTGSDDNLARVRGHGGLEFTAGSVLDRGLVDALVARADRVFHLAAAVGVQLIISRPVEAIQTNVQGTSNVLACCTQRGKSVLITSSSEVYGKSQALPFREDTDLVLGPTSKLRWLYACSKALGEFEAQACHHKRGLRVVVARLFNTTGPRQTGRYGMVIPRFVAQALAGEPITVYGDGRQSRCFCHVGDVVPALGKLVETPAAAGRVVNLGSDALVTIDQLARLVKEVTGSASSVANVPFERAYEAGFEDMPSRQPDLSAAQELIGFKPRKTLRDIVEDVVKHLKAA